jgi:hypothetical protein
MLVTLNKRLQGCALKRLMEGCVCTLVQFLPDKMKMALKLVMRCAVRGALALAACWLLESSGTDVG